LPVGLTQKTTYAKIGLYYVTNTTKKHNFSFAA